MRPATCAETTRTGRRRFPRGRRRSVVPARCWPLRRRRGATDGVSFWAYNEDATTVRLRVSTRHSTNAVLATAEVPLLITNAPNSAAGNDEPVWPNSLPVNIHNGPQRPEQSPLQSGDLLDSSHRLLLVSPRHPWIIRLRNDGRSACVIHAFAPSASAAGRFVFAAAQTQPLIGVTYTRRPDWRSSIRTRSARRGTRTGCIVVAAFTSEPGLATAVGDLAPFSSPGPLRAAAGPGQRAIDVAAAGQRIVSADRRAEPEPGPARSGGHEHGDARR